MIYAGSSYAICALEILVRSGRQAPPRGHSYVRIDIPDTLRIERFDPKDLPIYVGQQMDVYIEGAPITAVRPAPSDSTPTRN